MNTSKTTKKENRKLYTISGIIAGVALIVVLILSLLHGCDTKKPIETPEDISTGIVYDTGAVVGGWDEADTDKIVESLNAKVEEGMINISMNTAPNFKNGAAEGNLMIVNEGVNRYPQVVELIRNDTGERIYKSGAIPVGSKIETAQLDVELDKGTYECTAMFYNVDPETGAYLGCAGAVISVNILE